MPPTMYSGALAKINSSKFRTSTLSLWTSNSQTFAWTSSRTSLGLNARRLVEKESTQTPSLRPMSMRSSRLAFGFPWKMKPQVTCAAHHPQTHRHSHHCRRHGRHLVLRERLPLLRQSWKGISQLHQGAKTKHTLRLQQNPARLRKYSARLNKLSIGTPWFTTLPILLQFH